MSKDRKHGKLARLSRVWIENPVYFLTICAEKRKAHLADDLVYPLLVEEWKEARRRHGWLVGRYVAMPDHVHFFCAPSFAAKSLSVFVGSWKEWTSKRSGKVLWQNGFFDHVLRTEESYGQKADYMENNPVRAGLVEKADDWPYRGDLGQIRL